jgi:hypothetical protein
MERRGIAASRSAGRAGRGGPPVRLLYGSHATPTYPAGCFVT